MSQDPSVPRGIDKRRGLVYPSPFFDIAQTYLPPTIKELFKYCSYFFYTDPLLGSVVYKIAEYPVTDFIYNDGDEHVRAKWKHILEDVLNLKPFLIEVGLDYFTFGNAFISINFPFKRLLECPECGHNASINDITHQFKKWEFIYECPKCKELVSGKIKDVPMKTVKDVNFIRWDPKNIEIEFNPLTGKSLYRYKIPSKIKKAILGGKPEVVNGIPWIFIQAIKKNRDLYLDEKNLFHFKRPTLAEQDQGWGKPLILHSMKRLFYLYVLRRAQEAIALGRILPLEFIFPQPNASQDPYQHTNLSNWSGNVKKEVNKWKLDPNHIAVIPVPLGFERMGGDGRALMLGPEIDITNKEVTGGMGVPLEFVFGGLSWSGSSVSLRTLENHFLTYRRLLLQFVNFVKRNLVLQMGLPNIDITFTEFKMADDIQRKQLVVQLNAAQKISTKTLLTELGFDYESEQKIIRSEIDASMNLQERQMVAQAKAQGAAQLESIKHQSKAQKAQQEADMEFQEMYGPPPGQEQPMAQQQQPQQQQQEEAAYPQAGQAPPNEQQQPTTGQVDAEMAQHAGQEGVAQQSGQDTAQGKVLNFDPDKIAKGWATKILKQDQATQNAILADLRTRMPNMYQVVLKYMSQATSGETAGDAAERQKPLPEAAPPRSKNSPI